MADWRKRDDVRSVLVPAVLRERLRSAEGELAAQEQRVKELDADVKGPPGAAWVARAHAGFYRERCEELRALLGDATVATSCGGGTR